YTYPKRKRLNMNYQEKPRDWSNHAMDAWGYFVWARQRFQGEPVPETYSYMETHIEPEEEGPCEISRPPIPAEVIARLPQSRGSQFLGTLRSYHERGPSEPQTYLEVAR